MFKRMILLCWLAVILFPAAWLAQQSRVSSYWFDRLTPEWVHIIGHSFLFAVLALVLLSLWKNDAQVVGKTLLLILIAGMMQESIQVMAIGKPPGIDELFDIGVDLLGGMCGMSVFLLFRKAKSSVYKLVTP